MITVNRLIVREFHGFPGVVKSNRGDKDFLTVLVEAHAPYGRYGAVLITVLRPVIEVNVTLAVPPDFGVIRRVIGACRRRNPSAGQRVPYLKRLRGRQLHRGTCRPRGHCSNCSRI